MHVAVASDHDARHYVANDTSHQHQTVDDAERHSYQAASVSLSEVHRQVRDDINVRDAAVVNTAVSRWREHAGRPSQVRHCSTFLIKVCDFSRSPADSRCYSSWSQSSKTLKRAETFGEPRKYSVTN